MTTPGGGRTQVAPLATIASDWGNSVWDQSINGFPSAASRDSQWPSPHDGATCYLADVDVFCDRIKGAWVVRDAATVLGSALVGTYTGQPTKLITAFRNVTTNASGAAVLVTAAQMGNGVLSAWVCGAATFQITGAVSASAGDLIARLWNGTTLAVSTTVSITYGAVCF